MEPQIEYRQISANIRVAEWTVPGEQSKRMLSEVLHACGHWTAELAPLHFGLESPQVRDLAARLTAQDCLPCQNRAAVRARRAARKASAR